MTRSNQAKLHQILQVSQQSAEPSSEGNRLLPNVIGVEQGAKKESPCDDERGSVMKEYNSKIEIGS